MRWIRVVGIGVAVAAVVAGSAYWFWPKGPEAGPQAMTANEWTTDGACGLLTADEVRDHVTDPGRPGRGPRAVERSVRVDEGRDGETVLESCTFDTYWAIGPVTVQVRRESAPQESGNLHLYADADGALDEEWDSWKRADRVAITEVMADSLL